MAAPVRRKGIYERMVEQARKAWRRHEAKRRAANQQSLHDEVMARMLERADEERTEGKESAWHQWTRP